MNIQKIEVIHGRAMPKPAPAQNTDAITPPQFLKTITFRGMEKALYFNERFNEGQPVEGHPLNNPRYDGAIILLAGRDYGCGSSRQHSPEALKRYGFQAIVAPSFHEIFRANSKQIGLVTVTLNEDELLQMVEDSERNPITYVNIDLRNKKITSSAGRDYACDLPEGMRKSFLDGSWYILPFLVQGAGEVEKTLARTHRLEFR